MSMLLMVKAMSIEVGNSTRKFVLLKLADNANDKGECFPSYQHIADHCEISRRSAINHINALCEQGFVKKVYRKGEKGNSSNIFILNLDGEKSALPNEESALDGENNSLPSENDSPPPSEKSAPRTSHSFESVNESVIEPKKINKKDSSGGDKPKKASQLSDYFQPNDHHHEIAQELNINLNDEFTKFKDYCLANGRKYVDWNAGFNNWLRNAGKFQKNNKAATGKSFMTREDRNKQAIANMEW